MKTTTLISHSLALSMLILPILASAAFQPQEKDKVTEIEVINEAKHSAWISFVPNTGQQQKASVEPGKKASPYIDPNSRYAYVDSQYWFAHGEGTSVTPSMKKISYGSPIKTHRIVKDNMIIDFFVTFQYTPSNKPNEGKVTATITQESVPFK